MRNACHYLPPSFAQVVGRTSVVRIVIGPWGRWLRGLSSTAQTEECGHSE
jgi:hypothetical protein